MANTLTLSGIVPATVPADGWMVGYRILGTLGPYTVAGPFVTQPINISTADPVGTLYEGYILRDCGDLESTQYFWETECDCANAGVGYVVSPGGDECQLVEEEEPDITNSGFCLAVSQNGAYTNYSSRIYNPGFSTLTLNLTPATPDAFVYGEKTTAFWANPGGTMTDGPLNREGVWIDSDCNGTKNALAPGVQTTLSYVYNNPGAPKTIFVGVGADNQFQVVVNGTQIADSGTGGSIQFKIWHIIPMDMVTGPNLINVIATGDGSVNDAMGMVVYDNTAAQILAASTDLDLTISFASHSLVGTTFDIATCGEGFSLDTSGGSGNYICRRITYAACNQAAP